MLNLNRRIIALIIVAITLLLCVTVVNVLASESAKGLVLRRDKSFAEQVTKPNTIYEVRYAFDLRGRSVTIPQGCVLRFNGGTILNGTIVGNGTGIENKKSKAIISEVSLAGTWDVETAYPEWFGAAGDGSRDDRVAVQMAFNVGRTIELKKHYLIQNAPFDYRNYRPIPDDELQYYLDVLAQKNRTPKELLTPLKLSSNKRVVISGMLKAYSPLGILIELKGDNTVITGGGTISGCGIVNTVNVYSGKPDFTVTNWESALVYIKGSNNRIEGITIKDPTRQGISIDDYLSKNNVICNNVFGGGLKAHTQAVETCNFTGLFAVYARGTNTLIKGNIFKPLDNKSVYDALYCNYSTTNVPKSADDRTEVHTVFENNTVEDVLEHAVYSYAANLRITGNAIRAKATALQLFNRRQFVDSNTIYCNDASLGIYVSGEGQVITNNKIYGVGLYGIRCAGYYNGSCDEDYVAGNYIEKVMAPFSEEKTQTTPAITFESTPFRDNKLSLNKITCENNTIECVGEAKSARTVPINGIIAVFGSEESSIGEIIMRNNTVLNSNVANNIAITLLNKTRKTVAYIEGNTCVNTPPIHSSIPYDPVLSIQGVKAAYVNGNKLEQQGTLKGVKNAGAVFKLLDVDYAFFSDNEMLAQMYSNNYFFTASNVGKFEIDGSNVINGCKVEQVVTIPEKSTDAMSLRFTLPKEHSRLEIVPIDDVARQSERRNPLVVESSDIRGVRLRRARSANQPAQYKVKVVYY